MKAIQPPAEARKPQVSAGGPDDNLPAVPLAVKDAKATREQLFVLRHFHLGDPAARGQLERVGGDMLPALLAQFRDSSLLRYDYPLILLPADFAEGRQPAEDLARPLSRWLRETVAEFAPEEGTARILKDHLPWLERDLRRRLVDTEGPVEAQALLREAGQDLQAHLKLRDQDRERLAADLEQLSAAAHDNIHLLGYGRYAAIHLLIHAVRGRMIARRSRFVTEVESCIRGLRQLLSVEWSKSDEFIEPRMVRDSVGPAGRMFDPAALSSVMDHTRGTQAMSDERRKRIEAALAVLQAWHPDPVLLHCVHGGKMNDTCLEPSPALQLVADDDPCARATELFDRQAARQAEIFSAVRIARLEIDGIYDPVIHDPWFANFNWEAFSQQELLLVPTVIALDSADRVAGQGMRSFSRLLSSGRPVQILIRIRPYNNPSSPPEEDPFHHYRTELGYLGISHRQAVVNQCSAARHEHLLNCYLASLDATRTSLHLINTGLRDTADMVPLNAWLVAGAAIESRAHPFFRINPTAGDSAAVRMDFSGNPQADQDWPVHPFRYRDENGNAVETELAFTFADYCLLIAALREHFRLIPPGCESDALIPIQEYLAMDQERATQKIPFVWGVDANQALHRLVVSRELTLACLDRLNYWHTLQEMAGVRNRYVELAIARTRQEEQAHAAAERERLTAEYAAELERVRREAAGEAMQRLTDLLLGLDFGASMPGAVIAHRPRTATAPATTPAEAAVSPPPPLAEQPEEEETGFDEPWIDTILCTSCNDCLKINPLLFSYNEEKQASLGDTSKGTYAQLVEAAELCPARCIHPGKPWNPDEPNLEELMRRAAPFNQ